MRMLQDSGVDIAIITGRTSQVVKHRVTELGIKHVYQGKRDKLPAFEELLANTGLTTNQIAYVGDDVVDLPVMTRVGFAICVQDGHSLVKKHAHWITEHGGGRGAARDVCELILESQGKLDALMTAYVNS